MSDDHLLLAEAREQILKHAGPFNTMSTAAYTGLSDWFSQVPAGRSRTRAELCERSSEVKTTLFYRLGFIGAFACEEGLSRIRRDVRVKGKAVSAELELEDLQLGEATVSLMHPEPNSPTVLCP